MCRTPITPWGDDLFASWHDVRTHLESTLGLPRKPAHPAVLAIGRLGERG